MLRKVFSLLVFIALFLLWGKLAKSQYNADFSNAIALFENKVNEPKKIRVAVENIVYQDMKVGSALSVYLANLLSQQIQKSSRFEEFSRKDLEKILEEIKLSQSDLFDPKYANELGKLKGVEALITGEYLIAANDILISLRLLSIKTSKVVETLNLRLPKSMIPEGLDLLPTNYQIVKENSVDLPEKGKLSIQVWTPKGEGGVYQKGEKLKIFFKSNKDCFVRLYHIDVNGKKQLIFPNQFHPENKRIIANQVYEFPDETMNFDFELGEPYGTEQIIAIASTQPFTDKVDPFQELEGKTKDVLTRGINIKAKAVELANARFFFTILENVNNYKNINKKN